MLKNGWGSSETPGNESDLSILCALAIGHDWASSEDGINLSGSNEDRLGYCRQSPIMLNAVWRESQSIRRTLWILRCGGFWVSVTGDGEFSEESEGFRSSSAGRISSKSLGSSLTVCCEECCPRSASNLWVSWHRYQRLWRYTPGIALSRSVMSFIAISKTLESWNAKSRVLSWLQAVPLTGSGCRIQDVLGSQEAIGFKQQVFVSRIGPSYHDRLEGQVSQIMRFVGDVLHDLGIMHGHDY